MVEAKPEGTPLSGVAEQTAEYLAGLPPAIPHVDEPLPFAYECSGVESFFRSERDPQPRSRMVFSFHQPATLVAGPDREPPLQRRFCCLFWQSIYEILTPTKETNCGSNSFNITKDINLITGCPTPGYGRGLIPRFWIENLILWQDYSFISAGWIGMSRSPESQ